MNSRAIDSILIPLLIAALEFTLAGRVAAQTYTNLHTFTGYPNDGANPQAGLILSGNTFYGTASGGGNSTGLSGTVFKINTDGSGFTNFYYFTAASYPNYPHTNSDGAIPEAGLILSGGALYGTANIGGSSGAGTVFKVNTDGLGFTNLHSFIDYPNDGANPQAGLILSGNTLYGTAANGGSMGNGTVFRINTDGSGFTNIYSFTAGNDGAIPQAGLVSSGNTLYGTAEAGGNSDSGTIFAVDTNGMNFTNLYDFTALDTDTDTTNSDGANPRASLILSGNTLYGTAANGGGAGNGTVFRINTDSTGFTNLYTFTATDPDTGTNSDGAIPQAGLILWGNTLYGTTSQGGANGGGTVFAINTDGTGYTNLYSFNGVVNNGGASPFAGLTLSANTLYGTTRGGGIAGNGTVFGLPVVLASAPQPDIINISLSATNLVINASNGQSGGIYETLMSTNLALPLNEWMPVATNVLSANGSFTIIATNAVNRNVPQRFYILQVH